MQFSLKDAMEKELDRLEREGAIRPVSSSDWATPLVVVPKPDGSVRLCGDYKVIPNPQLQIDTYTLPAAEEMRHHMSGGKHSTPSFHKRTNSCAWMTPVKDL